jgi:hypothetical protein
MDFEVFIRTKDDQICGRIEGNFVAGETFFFYLVKDGAVISRNGWFEKPEFSWGNVAGGIYHVRGFVQRSGEKTARFSDPIRVVDPSVAADWDGLRGACGQLPDLPYEALAFPHQDILVALCAPGLSIDLPGFFKSAKRCGDQVLSAFFKSNPTSTNGVIFSGSAFCGDHLVFGPDEAGKVPEVDNPLDSTGDFVCVLPTTDGAIITNDYFGVQKIYVYRSGKVFMASNRVHLLQLALAVACIDTRMDSENIQVMLLSGYTQQFQQIFSDQLMVDGVEMIPINRMIKISDGQVAIVPKPIDDILGRVADPVPQDEYIEALEAGVSDIIRQARAVLSHDRFRKVVFDATGGMDSRVILSAAAQFLDQKERIKVSAQNTITIPMDIRVACTLADMLGFEHDSIDEVWLTKSPRLRVFGAISQLLGTYFAYKLGDRRSTADLRKDTINVTGFFGEICLRAYYSRVYLETDLAKSDDPDEFMDLLMAENRSALTDTEVRKKFREIYGATLQSLPGDSMIEKYATVCIAVTCSGWCTRPRASASSSQKSFSPSSAEPMDRGRLPVCRTM